MKTILNESSKMFASILYSYSSGRRRLSLSDGRVLYDDASGKPFLKLPRGGTPYDAEEAVKALNAVLSAAGRKESVALSRRGISVISPQGGKILPERGLRLA